MEDERAPADAPLDAILRGAHSAYLARTLRWIGGRGQRTAVAVEELERVWDEYAAAVEGIAAELRERSRADARFLGEVRALAERELVEAALELAAVERPDAGPLAVELRRIVRRQSRRRS